MVKRNMTTHLLTTAIVDDRMPARCSGVPAHDVTPLEIQRWEDDGGAVFPNVTPRHRLSSHHKCASCTMPDSLAA